MGKIKRFFTGILAGIMLMGFTASAGATWYTCSIDMVGSASSILYIRLSDTSSSPEFSKTWYFISGDRSKEMLATGLTAVSMSKKVLVNLQGIEQFSDMTAIYLIP